MIFDINGSLKIDRIIKGLKYGIKFYEAFRTFFAEDKEGNPYQVIISYEEIKNNYSHAL